MATNNAINNTLPTPFTVGATSVTTTGTQLNLLNSLTLIPINKVVIQEFSSSGTYTPTAGMKYCRIDIVGGGGAGGGTSAAGATTGAGGGGGGSGSYGFNIFTAATIGASQTVTIGAGGTGVAAGNGGNGGTSSVGALITALGGLGGIARGATALVAAASGGAGATAGSGGALNFIGNPGSMGITTGTNAIGGNGAPSYNGGAALGPLTASGSSVGAAGQDGSGAGGSGSVIFGVTGTTLAGGNGGAGSVYITEFCSA